MQHARYRHGSTGKRLHNPELAVDLVRRFQQLSRRFGAQHVAAAGGCQKIGRVRLTGLEFLDPGKACKAWDMRFEVGRKRRLIQGIGIAAHAVSGWRSISVRVSQRAVSAGFFDPSISMVTSCAVCTQPEGLTFTSASTKCARMRAPVFTGARKRSVSKPWLTPILVFSIGGIVSNVIADRSDNDRKPCAMVPPNGVSRAARSGSQWMN